MWGFFPAHSTHCPLWGAKPARICPRPRVWSLGFVQGLIRHALGASLTDVGLRVSSLKEVKIPKTTLYDEWYTMPCSKGL